LHRGPVKSSGLTSRLHGKNRLIKPRIGSLRHMRVVNWTLSKHYQNFNPLIQSNCICPTLISQSLSFLNHILKCFSDRLYESNTLCRLFQSLPILIKKTKSNSISLPECNLLSSFGAKKTIPKERLKRKMARGEEREQSTMMCVLESRRGSSVAISSTVQKQSEKDV